ncbi:unnamed protein product [Cylicocyclus nassatus]|uniref:Uncharacterized protein n=1 Tax=Cylicocyclus nassatus TaxID=53992 RepID=A0AA36HC03_CYLNA|nr:unnamed protein product [Cylicocyclus nassatus]
MRCLAVFLLLCPIIRPAVINLNQLKLPQILHEHDLGEVDLNQLDLPQFLKLLNSQSGSAGKEGHDIYKINIVGGTRDMNYVCDVWCPKVKKLLTRSDQNVNYWVTLKGTKKTFNRDDLEEVCSICQKHKNQISAQ